MWCNRSGDPSSSYDSSSSHDLVDFPVQEQRLFHLLLLQQQSASSQQSALEQDVL